jgi:hypothetical protein
MIDKRKVEVARLENNIINVKFICSNHTFLVDSFKSNPLVNGNFGTADKRDLKQIFSLGSYYAGNF